MWSVTWKTKQDPYDYSHPQIKILIKKKWSYLISPLYIFLYFAVTIILSYKIQEWDDNHLIIILLSPQNI